jgi:FkbM family methyltransferase
MFKKIIKKIFQMLGYEIKKRSTRELNLGQPEMDIKSVYVEFTEKEIKKFEGVSNHKNLLLAPQNNNLTIDEMRSSDNIWGFTKCISGNAQFYMAILGNDDGVALRFYHNGHYEKFTLDIWSKLALSSKLILDVGAHTGSYTLSARVASPSSKVISFEPHYLNFGRLALNLRANGFEPSDVHMIAASDKNQNVYFQVPKDLDYHSSGGKISENSKSQNYHGYWVNSVSLDNFLLEEAKNSVDLVKIDTEGHELNVLKGMTKIIEINHPTIFFECITQFNLELEEFFNKHEYEIYWIDDSEEVLKKTNNLEPFFTTSKKLDMNKLNRIAIHKSKVTRISFLDSKIIN